MCIKNIPSIFVANLSSSNEIEEAFKIRSIPPLAPFHAFFALDNLFEELRQTASKEIVCLVPTQKHDRLQCFGLPDPCPQLRGFVQRQACLLNLVGSHISPLTMMQSEIISTLTKRHGMKVVSMDGPEEYPPETFRLDTGGSLWTPDGYLGLAVLLCDREVDMIVVPDNEEVVWKPGDVLCFTQKGPKARNDQNRIYFLLVLLEVEPI